MKLPSWNNLGIALSTPARHGVVVILLALFGVPLNASAQDEMEGANMLEEVTVTAQKREQSLQDTPVAITAFTGTDIERAGGFDPSVLGDLVPNLNIGMDGNRDGVFITIRGISGTDVRNGADPTTAFHVDGSYVARLSGSNAYFFDTERIEVLRGPQGTLYGRNSTSGVINVISKKPDTEGYAGDAELTLGDYDLVQIKGAINIPLGENFAARFAVVNTERDGYRDNGPDLIPGDDADEFGFRGHLLWNIGDNTSLLFTGERYERGGVGIVKAATDFDGNPNSDILAPDPANFNVLDSQGVRDNADTNFRFQLDHSFNSFDLFFQSAYRKHERFYVDDNDGWGGPFNGVDTTAEVHETTEAKLWTHELRLTSTWDGPFQAIAGLFYLDEEINGDFDFQGVFDPATNACPPNTCPWPNGFNRQSVRFIDRDQTANSKAAYLHTTYDFSDSLHLVAGLRWTEDEKDKGGIAGDNVNGSVFILSRNRVGLGNIELFNAPQISNPSWSKTTWKLGLDYNVNDDSMVYGTLSTGYKSGGYNRGSNFASDDGELIVFNPEEITALEGGFKSEVMDGRARINLAAFYYDYTDMQQAAIFTTPGGVTTNVTHNAASSDVWGVELEADMLTGESGLLKLSLGYLNATFGEFSGVQNALTGELEDVSGNDLTAAPEFTATLAWVPATWNALSGVITPRIQFHYESDAYFSVLNRPFNIRDSYIKTDLSVYYQHNNSGWYGEAFVSNLTDEEIVNSQSSCGNILPGVLQSCTAGYAAPRQWGIRVGFRM